MKNIKFFKLTIVIIMLLTLAACSDVSNQDTSASSVELTTQQDKETTTTQTETTMPTETETTTTTQTEPMQTTIAQIQSNGQIYLYGERHAKSEILSKELELWGEYYNNENMRHLFIESPYYTAEFLNVWMRSEDDDILNRVFNDWVGTMSYDDSVKEFYKSIKRDFPETIFHGTDVGHQYNTTGFRFSRYLEDNNMQDSEQYRLTREAIEQGKYFYEHRDDAYRENTMTENFIREFDNLKNENIMGIYGSAHTDIEAMAYSTNDVPCMANQLYERYGDLIYSEDLSMNVEHLSTDVININGKDYEALYYGEEDISWSNDFESRRFWRIENAYDDFKDKPTIGNVLPYNNYPMPIEVGQVFVIDYTKIDGSIERWYYRSDGNTWNDMLTTEQFIIE